MVAIPAVQSVQTFVLRLWREPSAQGGTQLRGRIEHVGSDEVVYVEDAAGLVQFIERWTGDLQPAPEC